MFHAISECMLARMRELERLDAADRVAKAPRMERLRQIPPETGKFIALLAAAAPAGVHLEIGTSAGYSTMWLSLACREKGCKLTTYEVLAAKAKLARETFARSGIEDIVQFVEGDAREHLAALDSIAFCFLDAEKEVYADCYELVVPRMVTGGILVADNAISHAADLQPMIDRALADERVDALVVPIGKGELVFRKR